FGLPAAGPVLLFFGRFLPPKRVDLLIDYIGRSQSQGRAVSALIFGAGSEKESLIRRAQGLPIVFRAHDDRVLARAMRIAAGVVQPGFAGLAITHAFALGLPVITRDIEHPPEIAYLVSGENGLILPADAESFFRGLDAYLDDGALQLRLRAGAKAAGD